MKYYGIKKKKKNSKREFPICIEIYISIFVKTFYIYTRIYKKFRIMEGEKFFYAIHFFFQNIFSFYLSQKVLRHIIVVTVNRI